MGRYYVNVTGIPLNDLEFMGYVLVDQGEDFILLDHKGDEHVLSQRGCRHMFVEDPNDAAIFRGLSRIPAPPAEDE